jgi:putative transposase
VSATSVRKVLLKAGLMPAPERTRSSWRTFLRRQTASTLARDFLTVETAFLQRIYVLFFISLATRRIECIACSSNPDGRWVAQQARNLVMQLGDERPFRFLIHDRDAKFSDAFDEVFPNRRHQGDPHACAGTGRERLCRALGAHAPR